MREDSTNLSLGLLSLKKKPETSSNLTYDQLQHKGYSENELQPRIEKTIGGTTTTTAIAIITIRGQVATLDVLLGSSCAIGALVVEVVAIDGKGQQIIDLQ